MCVICFAKDVRPTDDQIARMFDHNKDGAGIAWFEDDTLCWKKGIFEVTEIQRLCREVPLPYVSHFRIATVGGVKDTLTHPFVIDKRASTSVEGRTKTAKLLFHNGHWTPWNDKVLDAAIHSNQEIPSGDWSDTRAMAWMCQIYSTKVLDMLTSQRAVVMNPKGGDKKIEIYTGDGWKKVNADGGVIWCSNDSWNFVTYDSRRNNNNQYNSHASSYYCAKGMCKNRRPIGKDICEECEKKAANDSEDHSRTSHTGGQLVKTTTALEIVTGGSPRPLAGSFTLREVEEFYIRDECSKNKYKNFKKAFKRIGSGGRKEIRALVELQRLSKDLASTILEERAKTVARLASGSTH